MLLDYTSCYILRDPKEEPLRNSMQRYLQKICSKELYVAETDQQELPEGSYYFKDILNCPVYDAETGEKLGVLENIETPGANDIWEIKPEKGKSFWIPNIESVVKKVDLANKRIEVTLLEGLRDEN